MSIAKPRVSIYEKDFSKWIDQQAAALKKGAFDKLDLENLIEEIESLSRSDKRALKSHLIIILMHMLKLKYQPDKVYYFNSWTSSISNSKRELKLIIEDSPSLKNHLKECFVKTYQEAVNEASKETGLKKGSFPKECPWSLEEVTE